MRTIWQVSYSDPYDDRGSSKVVAHYEDKIIAITHCEQGATHGGSWSTPSTFDGAERYGEWTIRPIVVYVTLDEFQADHQRKVREGALQKLQTALTAEERKALGL